MNERLQKVKQIFDGMNSLRLDEYSYYSFKRNVSEILNELNELLAEEQDAQKKSHYKQAYLSLAHTNDKEVEFIKYHQDLMRKKNAAKIRKTEYFQAVEKAYDQIYMDLMFILSI